MSQYPAHELGLLRKLAANLERRSLPFEKLTQEMLRREGIGHAGEKVGGIIAIRSPGHHALAELTNCLLDRLPAIERGCTYVNIQTELFNYIENYVGRDPSTVEGNDVESLINHFNEWFVRNALQRRVFVPCVISRTSAPRFEIGPVTFEYVDRVLTSDFKPSSSEEAIPDRHGFGLLVSWMRERDADWLARVLVDGCEQSRAEEIAELAVDLVIVALQLSAPYLDTRAMSRLDARRGTSEKRTLSEAAGCYNSGWTRKEPGMVIGRGTLPDILAQAAPIFIAVGNVVRSFASGCFRLPKLEQAWCDAAYWLHQALAESTDTIAVAKLETALEVLLRTESSKGSEQRLLVVLRVFFDLKPSDPIGPGSRLSAQQFARNIVRDRSRILHGTWSTLHARVTDRAGMEGFVVTVLRSAVTELEAYARSVEPVDDPDKFFNWVQQRKTVIR